VGYFEAVDETRLPFRGKSHPGFWRSPHNMIARYLTFGNRILPVQNEGEHAAGCYPQAGDADLEVGAVIPMPAVWHASA
jgi:hypothetical protein